MITIENLKQGIGFDGAIFDLDGTLLDSMKVWRAIDEAFFAERGIPFDPHFCDIVAPIGLVASAEYAIRQFGLTDTVEQLCAIWHGMAVEKYANEIELKPGAYAYIQRLKQCGKRLAIATASGRELILPALRRTGLLPFFDAVCTCDEVARPKGYPDICLYAAGRLGLAPGRCIVFEDALPGMQSGKAAGMPVVAVYDRSADSSRDAIRATADLCIDGFVELL